MQAVILAAGMGYRIRDLHVLPKGFIRLGEKTIIDVSIQKLKNAGINDVIIVTGYSSEYYVRLSQQDPAIRTCFNPHYHCYGSLYSLYSARHFVTQDFLFLESDIIYEARAIHAVLNDPHPNIVLLSGDTFSGDEVYVETQGTQLVRMSKHKNSLQCENIYGELVGINKINFDDYQQLMLTFENNVSVLQTGHYEEHGLVEMAKTRNVFCLKIADLAWSEIDHAEHLARARRVYEKI